MNNSVLLDTCFLINLFDQTKPFHLEATEFYKFFIEKNFKIFISSIVISEFCIKQSLHDIPMENFIPLNFSILDGEIAAKLNFKKFVDLPHAKSRESVKDDVKILAQAENNNIAYIATADEDFDKQLRKFKSTGVITVSGIYIPNGYNVYFEPQMKLFSSL